MAKGQSLAAQAGAVEFQLPAVFGGAPQPIAGRRWPPMVTFAHPKRADEWGKIVGKYGSVPEGTMFLIHNDRVEKLDEAKLGWFVGTQYWVNKDPAGNVLEAAMSERPQPFKEHVEACVLVYIGNEVLPANIQFRTVKCGAAKALSDEFLACQTSEWAGRSAAHQEALACREPFMRFFGLVKNGPTRTSKASGLPYTPLECSLKPTSLPEWRLLKAFSESETAANLLKEVAANYERRLAELKAKCK